MGDFADGRGKMEEMVERNQHWKIRNPHQLFSSLLAARNQKKQEFEILLEGVHWSVDISEEIKSALRKQMENAKSQQKMEKVLEDLRQYIFQGKVKPLLKRRLKDVNDNSGFPVGQFTGHQGEELFINDDALVTQNGTRKITNRYNKTAITLNEWKRIIDALEIEEQTTWDVEALGYFSPKKEEGKALAHKKDIPLETMNSRGEFRAWFAKRSRGTQDRV